MKTAAGLFVLAYSFVVMIVCLSNINKENIGLVGLALSWGIGVMIIARWIEEECK